MTRITGRGLSRPRVVGVEGLEPPTVGLEIRCSILLSYTPTLRQYDSDAAGAKSNCATAEIGKWKFENRICPGPAGAGRGPLRSSIRQACLSPVYYLQSTAFCILPTAQLFRFPWPRRERRYRQSLRQAPLGQLGRHAPPAPTPPVPWLFGRVPAASRRGASRARQ
jgi:hypothetical protein